MRIVIKMTELEYEKAQLDGVLACQLIRKGTPLPKGHGRLKDADNLINELQAFHDFYVNAWGGFKNMPNEDKRVADTILQCVAQIVNDPTIIEADY